MEKHADSHDAERSYADNSILTYEEFLDILDLYNVPLVVCDLFCAGFLHYVDGVPVIVLSSRLDDRYKTFYGLAFFLRDRFNRDNSPFLYLSDIPDDDVFLNLSISIMLPDRIVNYYIDQFTSNKVKNFHDVLMMYRLSTYGNQNSIREVYDRIFKSIGASWLKEK
ncbi:MAG: hypothetical protein JW885_12465 [Deltaproteobacteria bacterium]|nr:hypothetical protein [Candidatus Zymogenaceae bacterium]